MRPLSWIATALVAPLTAVADGVGRLVQRAAFAARPHRGHVDALEAR
jgi:hypothetical protein